MRNFFAELKRRKVYRVAVAYAVGAWLIAQVVTQIFPVFEISHWALRYAEVGELDHAIEQLTPLMKLPNGPTPALLRVEPEWDPLRGDPRFEQLMAG